jgi:hypothetical protein
VNAWGKKKQLYYNDDADFDDDAAEEEEQEAIRLQQERAKNMDEDDFLDSFGSMAARGVAGCNLAANDLEGDGRLVADVNDDLEKIRFGFVLIAHCMLMAATKR